jgi:hypothetical protein
MISDISLTRRGSDSEESTFSPFISRSSLDVRLLLEIRCSTSRIKAEFLRYLIQTNRRPIQSGGEHSVLPRLDRMHQDLAESRAFPLADNDRNFNVLFSSTDK